jgi:hypothetical protein
VNKIFQSSLVLLVLSACQPAVASSDDTEEMPASANAAQEVEIPEENFDQWVFQGMPNAAAGRERIRIRLKLQLEEIDRICGLSEEQKKKLELAARGDIKRFYDEVEVVRVKFRAARRDQNAFNEIWQDVQPLHTKLATGLFGDRSLFAKTQRKTLNPEQLANYRVVIDERMRFRYQATIAVALTTLEKGIPLRDAQRQAIVEMLVKKTRPPESFGSYDYYFVVFQLSRLPESQLKPLFDDRQWTLLKAQFAQSRQMEPTLVQQGLISKEEQTRPDAEEDDSPADASQPDQVKKQRINAAVEAIENAPADATRPE